MLISIDRVAVSYSIRELVDRGRDPEALVSGAVCVDIRN